MPLRFDPINPDEFYQQGLRLRQRADGPEIYSNSVEPDLGGTKLSLRMVVSDEEFLKATSLANKPLVNGICLDVSDTVTADHCVSNGLPAVVGTINLELPAKVDSPREMSWHFETFEAPTTWTVFSLCECDVGASVLCNSFGAPVAEAITATAPNGAPVYTFTTPTNITMRKVPIPKEQYSLKMTTGERVDLPMPNLESQHWTGGVLTFQCHVYL